MPTTVSARPQGAPSAPPRGVMVPRPRDGVAARLVPLFEALAEALYPPLCIACRAEVMTPHGLCPDCRTETHFITSPLCTRCGAPLHGAVDAPICDHCLHAELAFDAARAALTYGGAARRMVLRLKHADRLDLARPLGAWMAVAGAPLLAGADWVAPVPLHPRRLLARRANQAAELARRIAAASGAPFAPGLLRRVRATDPQKDRGREARAANLAGAFAVAPRAEVAGRRVVLVDDVMASGATLSACAGVLKAAGAAWVGVLVAARVASEDAAPIFGGPRGEAEP